MCRFRWLTTLCLILILPTSARSELRLAEAFEPPAIDGAIWCVREFGGDLIVGGLFQAIGREPISTLAAWDGWTWRSMGLEPGNELRVYCMTVFEGDLVVGLAEHPMVDGTWGPETGESYRVLRLIGTDWDQLGGVLPSAPRALEVHDNSLFVGLQSVITTRGERPVHRLVEDAWEPAGFPAGEVFISVHAMQSSGDSLLVGGSFEGPDAPQSSEPSGFPRGIYSWREGSWSPMGSSLQSDQEALTSSLPMGRQGVHDIAIFAGQIYATGSFVDTQRGIAGFSRWNGQHWEPLSAIGTGRQLTVTKDGLLLTGLIAHEVDGTYRYDLALFDGSSWIDLDPASQANPSVSAAGVWQGKVVLARNNSFRMTAGVGAPGITLFQEGEWTSPISGQSPSGAVHAFTEYDGHPVIGGSFDFAGFTSAAGVARHVGSRWEPFGSGLAAGQVRDFAEYRGTLVAGGEFLAADEDERSGVAFWNGSRWDSFAPDVSGGSITGTVRCLAVYQDEMWVGGDFTRINGIDAGGLARFDGTSWETLDLGAGPTAVNALEVFGDELVVGGDFQEVDGIAATGLARFDGTSWTEVPHGMTSVVRDLEVFQGELYVARVDRNWWSSAGLGLYTWSGADSLKRVVEDPGHADYFLEHSVWSLLADEDQLHMLSYREATYAADLISWDGTAIVGERMYEHWPPRTYDWYPVSLGRVAGEVWFGLISWTEGDPGASYLARLERDDSVALPRVDLRGSASSQGILLEWNLHNLTDVDRIEIEHATEDSDWTTVWQGNSTERQWTHTVREGSGVHRYRLVVSTPAGPIVSEETVIRPRIPDPSSTRITSAVPNPFNPATRIDFAVADAGPVSLRVYDVSGRTVSVLREEYVAAGSHHEIWNGEDQQGRGVASGVYLVVLQTPERRDVRRVALVR